MDYVRVNGTGKFVMYLPNTNSPIDVCTIFEKRIEDAEMHAKGVKRSCINRDGDFFVVEFTAQIYTCSFLMPQENIGFEEIEKKLNCVFNKLGFIFVKEFAINKMEFMYDIFSHKPGTQYCYSIRISNSKKKSKMKEKATRFFMLYGAYMYADRILEE